MKEDFCFRLRILLKGMNIGPLLRAKNTIFVMGKTLGPFVMSKAILFQYLNECSYVEIHDRKRS